MDNDVGDMLVLVVGLLKQPLSSQLSLTWKLEKIVWKPDILRIHSA